MPCEPARARIALPTALSASERPPQLGSWQGHGPHGHVPTISAQPLELEIILGKKEQLSLRGQLGERLVPGRREVAVLHSEKLPNAVTPAPSDPTRFSP